MTPDGKREADVPGTIYLLHFSQPVAHARHYIGFAEEGGLFKRLSQHEAATVNGSPLVRALIENGGRFFLAQVWTGTRNDERRLKNRKNTPHLCRFCRGERPLTDAPGKHACEEAVA